MATINRYGLPDTEKTTITEWRQGNSNKVLVHPELGNISNPSQGQYFESGWYLWVVPVPAEYQRTVLPYIFDEGANTVTTTIEDWTPEEIEASQKAAADLATLKDYENIYSDMMYWDGKTDAEIDTIVNGLFSSQDPAQIALACRTTVKMLAKSERDNVAMFKLMRGNGILPK